MAFDLTAQRGGRIPGFGRIEAGFFDFSLDSLTVEVATQLDYCIMGLGIAKSNDPDWQGAIATTDGDVSSGYLTFKRSTGYEGETNRIHYFVLGW